ncbi:MAG: WD40 repeat domain-containing protein, partial [Anaerolineaceae bacterium]|nr:WD40 repeat domain-containing protein [Anaerolineaceae bacterium]
LAHKSHITSTVFTPDSQFMLSAGMDNQVHYWTVGDWQLAKSLVGHENSVNSISLTADGQRVLTASTDRTVRLWDFRTGKQVQQYGFKGHTALLSPDDKVIAALDNPWLTLADAASGEVINRTKPFPKRTTAYAFSPIDSQIALGGQGDDIFIRSMPELDLNVNIEKAHSGYVLSVRFSPSGRLLVSAGYEQKLKFWDTATWSLLAELPLEHQGVQNLAFSEDGKTLAIASDHLVTLVEVDTRKIIHKEKLTPKGVYCVAFSPDGRWFVAGSADKRLRIWDLRADLSY